MVCWNLCHCFLGYGKHYFLCQRNAKKKKKELVLTQIQRTVRWWPEWGRGWVAGHRFVEPRWTVHRSRSDSFRGKLPIFSVPFPPPLQQLRVAGSEVTAVRFVGIRNCSWFSKKRTTFISPSLGRPEQMSSHRYLVSKLDAYVVNSLARCQEL